MSWDFPFKMILLFISASVNVTFEINPFPFGVTQK